MRGARKKLETKNWKLETNNDNAFISASGTMFTPTHELVHILGVDEHSDEPQNVMHQPTSTDNTILSSKRLTEKQITKMRTEGSQHLK
jgi:predicted Zn-dependent protease